jgi:hypothetical protein
MQQRWYKYPTFLHPNPVFFLSRWALGKLGCAL